MASESQESRLELFLKAMKDVEENKLSIRKAAKKWGVNRQTLADRINGKVKLERRRGPPPVLTKVEENLLAEWLIELSNRGFGMSKQGFLLSVKQFLDKDGRATPFKNNMPGRRWYRSFLSRNPKVKLRKARPLEKKRARITKEDVDSWFDEFETFLTQKSLRDSPAQLWNCDETGFDLQGRTGNVLGPSNQKEAPYQVTTGNRERITMLPCFNACGQWMPPYFIFPGKRIPVTYNPIEGGVQGSVFSVTPSGYMDTSTFYMWFANHFIPNLPPARPVVLLIDSHDSHLDLETFQLAEQNGVHIYALLKNATHMVQPADVSLFGPMKKSWYNSLRRFNQANPNADINRKNFCAVFKPTWEEVMIPTILSGAFRKSGIYPLDRGQVSKSLLAATNTLEEDNSAATTIDSATHAAFKELDGVLSTPVRDKYRRRVEENYDIDSSPTFNAWKKLYGKAFSDNSGSNLFYASTSTTQEPKERMASCSEPSQPLSDSRSRTLLKEILTYPTLEAKGPPKRKNVKRTIPNFVSGPESRQILLDEKLKKARELADKQKKLQEREEKKEERRKKAEEDKAQKEIRKREMQEKKRKDKENKRPRKR